MSRMSSDISEESKLDEYAAGAVSSASNVHVDDVYDIYIYIYIFFLLSL